MSITINIIYCTDNQAAVNNVISDFRRCEINFLPVHGEDEVLVRETLKGDGQSILLITDNFLKNEDCMASAYRNYHHALKHKNLLCIVADGFVVENDGHIARVSTRIEHVSQIMQYLNFWQEKYLSVKKQFSSGEVNETSHARIKSISTDMGAFLQLLRDSGFYYFENLKTRNYQQFCHLLGILQPPVVGYASSEDTATAEEFFSSQTEQASTGESSLSEQNRVELVSQDYFPDSFDAEFTPKENDIFGEFKVEPEKTRTGFTPHANEIDEDDFFELQHGVKVQGSNIDEIVDEILSEEEAEERVQNSEPGPETDYFPADDQDVVEMDDLFLGQSTETKSSPATKDKFATDEIFKDGGAKTNKPVVEWTAQKSEGADPESLDFRIKTMPFVTHFESKNNIASMDDNQKIKDELQQIYSLAKSGNLDAAAMKLETLLNSNPDSADVHFLSAEVAELQRNYLKARHHYEKVAALAPFFPKVYHKLSWLCMNHFQAEKKVVKSYFKQAMALDDNNPMLLYAYAEFLNDHGDTLKAIKYFKKVLAADPAHPFANYDLALIYHKAGDYALANRYYIEACENNDELSTPENDKAFTNYSILNVERAGEAINLHSIDDGEKMKPINKNEPDSELLAADNELADRIAVDSEGSAYSSKMSASVNKFKPVSGAKIVLVTGASSGIGRATAEVFAKNGYNLILTARRQDRLVELQNYFHKHYSGGCIILDFDIRDFNSIEMTFQNLDKDWRTIDILVNNAGLAIGMDPIHEGNPSQWDTMIDTNIKGLLYITRVISPGMVERRSGHIINLCSTAGKEAYPNGNVYSATKFAVESLTRNMRIDLHKYGIRVGQVSPGAVEETEFSQVRFLGDKDKAAKIYEGFIPLKASDVADVVYYMASAPAHVNIQDVLVMGTQQASATIIDRSGR